MHITRYNSSHKKSWDEFVSNSKNKHFLFFRDYMEYHSDRFLDFSLMVYDDKHSLFAILPANISGDKLISHQGLTFGGMILKSSAKQKDVLDVFSALQIFLKKNNFRSLIYKRVPTIYHEIPSDEDLYALFRIGARLIRRDVSSAIKLSKKINYSTNRKRIIKKSCMAGLIYSESPEIVEFWHALEKVLLETHGVKPVHSAEEIIYLKNLLPNNIKLYSAFLDGNLLAGTVIFNVGGVAHTQYLFNTEDGRELGALDGLIDYLIKGVYASFDYFDFGISNENNGLVLNEGLINQKEGFGARAIVHDFYEIFPIVG